LHLRSRLEFTVSEVEIILFRPNPEGFVYTSWKEREEGGMEGRKQ